MGKNTGRIIFHQRTDSALKKLRYFNLTVHNIAYKSCSYTDINFNTEIQRQQNLFLKMDDNSVGRLFLPTNSWRALKQRLLRTTDHVPGLLGQEQVEQTKNYYSKDSIPTLHTAARSFSLEAVLYHFLRFTSQTPSTKLPFPMNSLKHIHLNDSSPRMSSLSSLQWEFL